MAAFEEEEQPTTLGGDAGERLVNVAVGHPLESLVRTPGNVSDFRKAEREVLVVGDVQRCASFCVDV